MSRSFLPVWRSTPQVSGLAGFKENPCTPFRFVDPGLNEAGRRDIALFVTNIVRLAQPAIALRHGDAPGIGFGDGAIGQQAANDDRDVLHRARLRPVHCRVVDSVTRLFLPYWLLMPAHLSESLRGRIGVSLVFAFATVAYLTESGTGAILVLDLKTGNIAARTESLKQAALRLRDFAGLMPINANADDMKILFAQSDEIVEAPGPEYDRPGEDEALLRSPLSS